MKRYRYLICLPDGRLVRAAVLSIFSPFEVAARLPHALTFLLVPKGQDVFVDNLTPSRQEGPCCVYITPEGGRNLAGWCATTPRTESEAFALKRNAEATLPAAPVSR